MFQRNGPAVHQPLTPNDTAIRRQGITNLTCRDSSQWLTANPAFIFNKTCYHLRHMFLVLGSRKFCICGAPTDCFGDHALVCPQITVRNQTRNTAHSDVSQGLRNALQPRSVHSGYYIVEAWRIMSLAFIRLILKPLLHLISVQILRLSQHPCPTLVLLPLLMLH